VEHPVIEESIIIIIAMVLVVGVVVSIIYSIVINKKIQEHRKEVALSTSFMTLYSFM